MPRTSAMRVIVLDSVHQLSSSIGLSIPKIFGHGVKRPGGLDIGPFDYVNGITVSRFMDFLPASFPFPMPFRSGLARADRQLRRPSMHNALTLWWLWHNNISWKAIPGSTKRFAKKYLTRLFKTISCEHEYAHNQMP